MTDRIAEGMFLRYVGGPRDGEVLRVSACGERDPVPEVLEALDDGYYTRDMTNETRDRTSEPATTVVYRWVVGKVPEGLE